jgi:hygromycin-B 4-O-kinase
MTEIIEPYEAQTFIENHFGERASEITRLPGGDWSQAYALTLDGQNVVVRLGVHGEDYRKDQIMAGWSSEELPVPKVIEVGETDYGFFAVSERAEGEFLDQLDNRRMTTALPSLFSVMDAIRDLDVSNTEGYGMWGSDLKGPQRSWQDALLDKFGEDRPGSRTHGWRAALETSQNGAREFDLALITLERLAEHMPAERHLIHHDLLYHNVLVQDHKINAVLDWGNAMYGDHIYDAAWLLYCQPRYTNWPDIDLYGALLQHWEANGRVPENLEVRLLCYQIHVGLDALSYDAFKGNWEQFGLNRQQTMRLVDAAGRHLRS